ncbi:MAG: S26 family signal peptidase [Vulcanimicrobiaceae bacterium]
MRFSLRGLAIMAAVVIVLGSFASAYWIFTNNTVSEPPGAYLVVPGRATIGSLIIACAPPQAFSYASRYRATLHPGNNVLRCGMHGELLLKSVWGLPGDHMTITRDGTYRNGVRIPLSRSAIPLVPHSLVVPNGMIFAGTTLPWSYDSRIFGPMVAQSTVIPLLTQSVRWNAINNQLHADLRAGKKT